LLGVGEVERIQGRQALVVLLEAPLVEDEVQIPARRQRAVVTAVANVPGLLVVGLVEDVPAALALAPKAVHAKRAVARLAVVGKDLRLFLSEPGHGARHYNASARGFNHAARQAGRGVPAGACPRPRSEAAPRRSTAQND